MTTARNPSMNRNAIRGGDQQALIEGLLVLVSGWFYLADRSPRHPLDVSRIVALEGTAKAGLMAAASELRALLAESPQGRQALRDFGFQPILEHIEGE